MRKYAWKKSRLSRGSNSQPSSHESDTLTTKPPRRGDASTTDSFWKHCGKRRNCLGQQFLLFPQCFQLDQISVYPFVHILNIVSSFAAEFEKPKIGISDGLNYSNFTFCWGRYKPLLYDKILGLSKLNLAQWWDLSIIRWKTLFKNEEMLVSSILSFSQNVFKRLLSQGRWNMG